MLPNRSIDRPTIIDVARKAGVSTATVSRVLNGTATVHPDTSHRVRQVIESLGYTPRSAARQLASRRTNTIGLLLPGIGGDFFPLMLRGIEAYVSENGFDLLIYSTQNRNRIKTGQPVPVGAQNSDGILISTGSLDEEDISHLYATGFPMVLLHRSPPEGMKIPSVAFENKSGARLLMDHLIEAHGYQRIAFLRGPENNEDSSWREMGYRESLDAHGLPQDDSLIGRGGFEEMVARGTVREWMAAGQDLEAIFASDDRAATGAIEALVEAGVHVPEQVAVVGFDDVPTSRYLTPPLTTVRAPIEVAGREAARQLIRLIRSEEAEFLVLLPTELVIRRSCGCHEGIA